MVKAAVVQAAVAGSGRQHRAAQKGGEGIEAATGITDHPSALPPDGIRRAPLRFDLQGNRTELVATGPQLVAVMALKHEITAIVELEPTTGLGHVVELKTIDQLVAAGLAKLNTHGG
jgi:hypothetical protein